MKFFKPEDFAEPLDHYKEILRISEIPFMKITEIANAKLEREGKTIYRDIDPLHFWFEDKEELCVPTHKALLINIEPIEECKHEKEKVKVFTSEICGKTITQSISWYECQCGAHVEPLTYGKIE